MYDIQNKDLFWISKITILDTWKKSINVNSACHTCRAQQCWNKTKSIRPRPRPVWDQSCH